MARVIGYKVTIERGYNEFCFEFKKIQDAGSFIETCVECGVPTGNDYDKDKEVQYRIDAIVKGTEVKEEN